MRRIVLFALVLASFRASAGEYRLLIQSDQKSCRDLAATARATPDEATNELLALFQDREVRISSLKAIVSNARVIFCSQQDREKFEDNLVEMGARGDLARERKYSDFVLMLSTDSLLKKLEERLTKSTLPPSSQKRLEHLVREMPRWLAYRRTGEWPGR